MTARRYLLPLLTIVAIAMTSRPTPSPDEGMWPFHDLPLKLLKEKYGFEPSNEWLDHLRLSSVKISSGGSGSFISDSGLIATNHHVALEFVNQLSTTSADLVENGFLAKTEADEIKIPGAHVDQLVGTKNVSDQITVTGVARQNLISKMQKEASKETGLRCEIVPMHGGAQHFMYHYKVFNDIRLVWAPEKQLGFYGGDRDNFCYPRFCLDASFLRAYDNGKPAKTSHFLKWADKGVSEGDLIFISGNPASTGRYETMGQLRFKRDVRVPAIIKLIEDREAALNAYGSQSAEKRIEVLDDIFGLRNSLKFYRGNYKSFVDPQIWGTMMARESAFKAQLKADDPALEDFKLIEQGRQLWGLLSRETVFQRLDGPMGRMIQDIERLNSQMKIAENRRAKGFQGEALAKKLDALDKLKMNADLGERYLAASLETSQAVLGDLHPFVMLGLQGKTAKESCAQMVARTSLMDQTARRKFATGANSPAEFKAEPLLQLARLKRLTNERHGPKIGELEEAEEGALKRIAAARFNAYGKSIYPDATFTLRLSFGVVKGYELGTTDVPAMTNIYGLFARNASFGNQAPYDLPASWIKAKSKLNMETPMDFVCTGDTTGGNSGSPVVDRSGAIVGLLFDGNIQSLLTDNLYEEVTCRSVCVDTRLISHALDVVYGADRLLQELGLK
ncbi:MAG: hypothetical protein ACI97A_000711 [Planctomycetota bacterium]|jgi:hypothetical protein